MTELTLLQITLLTASDLQSSLCEPRHIRKAQIKRMKIQRKQFVGQKMQFIKKFRFGLHSMSRTAMLFIYCRKTINKLIRSPLKLKF